MSRDKGSMFWTGLLGAIAAVVIALPCGAQTAHAERHRHYRDHDNDHGFYIGVNFVGSDLDVDNVGGDPFFIEEEGDGTEFQFGYWFNDVFSLELSLGTIDHDTSDRNVSADLHSVHLFAYHHFSPGSDLRPYIKGGVGAYELQFDDFTDDATIEGGGVAFGGGVDYFFSRHFSIGLDYTRNIIEFEDVDIELDGVNLGTRIDDESTLNSFGVSIAYYF